MGTETGAREVSVWIPTNASWLNLIEPKYHRPGAYRSAQHSLTDAG